MKAFVRYIAVNTPQPEPMADFYKRHFAMRETARSPSGDVALTDGWVKLSLLASWPEDEISGLQRYGIAVDDIDELRRRLGQFASVSDLQPGQGGDFHGEYQVFDLCGMPWELSVSNFGLGDKPEKAHGVPRIRHMETSVADTDRHMHWLRDVFDLEEINTSKKLRAQPNAFPLRQLGDGQMNLTFLPFDKAPAKRMSPTHIARKWVGQHYGWVLPDMYGTVATIPYDLRTLWTAVGNMAEGQVHDPDLNVMDISETKGYEVAFDLWERGEGPGGPPAKLRMPAA